MAILDAYPLRGQVLRGFPERDDRDSVFSCSLKTEYPVIRKS